MNDHIFEVEDARLDERFKENALVTGDPNIRFYAGQPLVDPDGYVLGTLCVISPEPKLLISKQKRGLHLLAIEVMSLIVERRQKAELRNFESLFKLSNDMICVAGTDGFFKKVNPAFKNVLGWDTEVLLESSLYDFVHPDDLKKTRQEVQRLAMGKQTTNFTHRFRTQNKQYKILQWVASPDPTTGSLFAIARDITNERAREMALILSEERATVFF